MDSARYNEWMNPIDYELDEEAYADPLPADTDMPDVAATPSADPGDVRPAGFCRLMASCGPVSCSDFEDHNSKHCPLHSPLMLLHVCI